MKTLTPAFDFNNTRNELPESLVQKKLPVDDSFDSSGITLLDKSKTGPVFDRPIRPLKHAIVPVFKPLPGTFKLLQLWEGRVIEVGEKEFTSVISDRTNPEFPEEQVTIDFEEVTEDDIPLVKPGAVFYWSIGYSDKPGSPRVRESRIRFRRLPPWTQKEFDRVQKTAKNLEDIFKPNKF